MYLLNYNLKAMSRLSIKHIKQRLNCVFLLNWPDPVNILTQIL